ncbi:MAG TPA: hypothetical protein VFP68_19895, partial [Burkholderiaceae bacterium]|nr:hypothetical protein [Burkholderiaceae bacterium]
MAERDVVRLLAQRLHDCAAEGDWVALAEADRELAALLRSGTFCRHDGAIAELRRAHCAAQRACEREIDRVQQTMGELQVRRMAGLAYDTFATGDEVQA